MDIQTEATRTNALVNELIASMIAAAEEGYNLVCVVMVHGHAENIRFRKPKVAMDRVILIPAGIKRSFVLKKWKAIREGLNVNVISASGKPIRKKDKLIFVPVRLRLSSVDVIDEIIRALPGNITRSSVVRRMVENAITSAAEKKDPGQESHVKK